MSIYGNFHGNVGIGHLQIPVIDTESVIIHQNQLTGRCHGGLHVSQIQNNLGIGHVVQCGFRTRYDNRIILRLKPAHFQITGHSEGGNLCLHVDNFTGADVAVHTDGILGHTTHRKT